MQIKIILLATLILTACAPLPIPTLAPAQIATALPLSKPQSTSTPLQGEILDMTPIPSTPSVSGMQALIEQAKEDLARRLSTSEAQITIVDAKDVTWPNSSLGCPQPGMLYAEVLTPGYLILLNANGKDYEYHAGKSSDAFYCENPSPPVDGMPDNT